MATIATISEMFINAINEATKSAKSITDPSQKALVYANIAKALAATGTISTNTTADCIQTEQPSNVVNMTEGKESLKTKLSGTNKTTTVKKEVPVKPAEPVVAEPPSPVVEPEINVEWNEQNIAALQAELEFIQTRQGHYGDETMDEFVKNFSSGTLSSIADINPANIQGLVAYIEACEAEQAVSA